MYIGYLSHYCGRIPDRPSSGGFVLTHIWDDTVPRGEIVLVEFVAAGVSEGLLLSQDTRKRSGVRKQPRLWHPRLAPMSASYALHSKGSMLSQNEPPSGDQVVKHMSLWWHSHSYNDKILTINFSRILSWSFKFFVVLVFGDFFFLILFCVLCFWDNLVHFGLEPICSPDWPWANDQSSWLGLLSAEIIDIACNATPNPIFLNLES